VLALNCQPSGRFPHDVEPNEKNLSDLIRVAREMEAVGIAHDGDADRMMAVDEKGRFISGDKLLVLLARQAGAKKIVTTIDSSMVVEEAGFSVERTKVGDTFVSEELRKGGDFGGEPSGAWIFPKSSFCPDGIFAAAALVTIASKEKLSTLVDAIPQYPVYRGSVAGAGIKASDLKAGLMRMGAQSIDESDGLRLVFDDGWVLVRPSGTEPKIRITAEATSEARAHGLYDRAVGAVESMRG
jgi:phosphoglucosamine mutase